MFRYIQLYILYPISSVEGTSDILNVSKWTSQGLKSNETEFNRIYYSNEILLIVRLKFGT